MKFVFLIFIFFGCNIHKEIKDNRIVLRDYALCACIIEAYKQDSVSLDDASISVLYELSEYSINTNERRKIDSLMIPFVSQLRPLQHADYGNRKAIIYSCIQFSRSIER